MLCIKADVATPIGHPKGKKIGCNGYSAPAPSFKRTMEEGMRMEEGLPDTRARVATARLGHSHVNLEVLQPVMAPYAGAATLEQAQEYYATWKPGMKRYPGEITVFSKERRTVNIGFKDGDWADEVPMNVKKRTMYGDSCEQALLREEETAEPVTPFPLHTWATISASRAWRSLPPRVQMCLLPTGSY